MARVRTRRLFWDPPADTDLAGYRVYVASDGAPTFLDDIDAGNAPAAVMVSGPQWVIDLPDGQYQFAVTAVDQAGNESDPYQHPDWQSVVVDRTPPNPPTGGGIEFVS